MRINLGSVNVGLAARWGIALWDDSDATKPADWSLVNSYLERHIETALETAENEALEEGKVTRRD